MAQEVQPSKFAAPARGIDARRRLSKQDNKDVMRAYFIATDCEANTMSYRMKFMNVWKNIMPVMKVTVQRICDQQRSIFTKNLLSAVEINMIREQINSDTHTAIGNCKEEFSFDMSHLCIL